MDFTPNPDHEAIREGVRRITKDFPDTYWADCDERHEFPWDFYKAMAEAGWVGICIPEEYGGGGQGITEATIVLQEIARSGAAMNGCSAIHLSIFGMNPVVKFGTDEQKRKYLPAVADGSLHVAFGVTEPDAGTDTASISTRARREGDHYVVRGPQGLDHEGPLLRQGPAAHPHHPPRGGQAPHRGHDAVPGRPAAARGHDHPHPQGGPQRGGQLRGGLRRPRGRRG